MVEIAVEEVMRIQSERWNINELEFDDIIWTYKGKPIEVDPKLVADYSHIGLNNCDFITSNYLPNRPWHHLGSWVED